MIFNTFVDADRIARKLYQRCITATEAGLYDAAAFYMRKVLEVIASSFIDRYDEIGQGEVFNDFLEHRRRNRKTMSLDDKIDFLLDQGNIPNSSKKTYNAIRKYGNAAVHEVDFEEDVVKHLDLMVELENELHAFRLMTYDK